MPARAGNESRWDERIARARALAAERPAAAEALIFYAAIAEYQKSLVEDLPPDRLRHPSTLLRVPRVSVEGQGFGGQEGGSHEEFILDLIPGFLSWLPSVAPTRLADAVAEMRGFDRTRWRHLLRSSLLEDDHGVADHAQVFVLEALLQPFAERLATRSPSTALTAGVNPPLDRHSSRCPHCGGLPVVGVLRERGHGARRALICGRCLTEREYVRVVCPACDEQQFEILPVYTAEQFAHVRIEACDRCHRYLKTIDLSKNGLAVPIVDDIASMPLDLWARDRGYVRLRANLLGL